MLAFVLALSVSSGCTADPSSDEDVPEPASGRVLHAEPREDDEGTGTADDPYGSLERAMSRLRAGDTLVLGGGTYEERIDLAVSPGRKDAPVRIRPEDGARVVLKGLLWLEEPDWWHISGVNVTWSRDNEDDEHLVKIDGGRAWVLSDAEVWGARSYAGVLVVGDPEEFVLRRLYVHDTKPTNGTNQDHLVYLNSGRGGGVVEGCLLVGSPNGRAVKIGPPDEDGGRVANVVLRYNTMVDNRGPSNVQLAFRSNDNLVYRNVMVGAGEGRPNVTTFELDGSGNVVRDNIGADSTGVMEEDAKGLEDGGGNRMLDPRLQGEGADGYVPTAPEATEYGHTALPED